MRIKGPRKEIDSSHEKDLSDKV